MSIIKSETGIIGYFDVLGYTNFLEQNTTEEAAQIIEDIFIGLQNKISKKGSSCLTSNDSKRDYLGDFKKINWLFFSDTILLTFAYQKSGTDEKSQLYYWSLVLLTSILLYTDLFQRGLPIRGTINYGNFIVKPPHFAGKSIVDAYNISNQLDLSAIIIMDEGEKELNRLCLHYPYPPFFEKYLIPRKHNESKLYNVLRPGITNFHSINSIDIRQGILDAFWKHNKQLRNEESSKVNNTDQYFRFCKMKYPEIFK